MFHAASQSFTKFSFFFFFFFHRIAIILIYSPLNPSILPLSSSQLLQKSQLTVQTAIIGTLLLSWDINSWYLITFHPFSLNTPAPLLPCSMECVSEAFLFASCAAVSRPLTIVLSFYFSLATDRKPISGYYHITLWHVFCSCSRPSHSTTKFVPRRQTVRRWRWMDGGDPNDNECQI